MNLIRDIKALGIEAFLAGGLGVFFLIIGWYLASGIAFGVFATRNYDLVYGFIQEKIL